MPHSHQSPVYAYVRSADQASATPVRHPVVVVGAGPCGLTAAIDLAVRGHRAVLLDDNDTVSVGSRAICFSKRTLEIWDRCGCAAPLLEKGVVWRLGKVFLGNEKVYEFDLLPQGAQKMPAFINLQQYYVEEALVERALSLGVDIRWRNAVTDVEPGADGVRVDVETPDGPYRLDCDWLVAADGANSRVRDGLGLESKGQVFNDRFLIADVVMHADFPTERWFWFDPPFHPNQSVLLHRQADNVFRIDFQLGAGADATAAVEPANIEARIRAMLGPDVEWSLDWASVYTFRCRKMDSFVAGRVLFAGDAAHQVSPFGARGANGGVQSVENLAWKLDRVLRGRADASLLATYDEERQHGARENILNSTRATDFITPKDRTSRMFRDSVLRLARRYPFARALVNSGRLSVPCVYERSSLNTPDTEPFAPLARPGSVCPDAPIVHAGRRGWLLERLGRGFVLLVAARTVPDGLRENDDLTVLELGKDLEDVEGLLASRLDLAAGGAYLLRPDQHVAARFRTLDTTRVRAALARACGGAEEGV
jgi:3-(3-hydroxy-phenyl)propionate hydroxylase